MNKINLREALVNLDIDTDFHYSLTELYEACDLKEEEKNKLVKMISAPNPDLAAVNSMLAEKAGVTDTICDDDLSDEDMKHFHYEVTESYDEEELQEAQSNSHPEEKQIRATLVKLPGTSKVKFDWINDGTYKNPDNHLIILVFTNNDFEDPYFANRRKWRQDVLLKLSEMGWGLEDPVEDHDSYLYLVMQKIGIKENIKEEPLEESWTSAYQEFIDLVDNMYTGDNAEEVDAAVTKLYQEHAGERDWDNAWLRWLEPSGEPEDPGYEEQVAFWESEMMRINGHKSYMPREQTNESWWEPKYDENEWEPEDIELHKSIDWQARNYRDYPVPEDSITARAFAYGLPGGTQEKEVKFIKYIRPNSIFPPYYAVEKPPFEGVLSGMYDGDKYGKYMIMNRFETQDVYDQLSEGAAVATRPSISYVLSKNMDKLTNCVTPNEFRDTIMKLVTDAEVDPKEIQKLQRALYSKKSVSALWSTIGTYMTGIKVSDGDNWKDTKNESESTHSSRHKPVNEALTAKDYTVQSVSAKLKRGGFKKSQKEMRIVPNKVGNLGHYAKVDSNGFKLSAGYGCISIYDPAGFRQMAKMREYLQSLGYEFTDGDLNTYRPYDIIIPDIKNESESINEDRPIDELQFKDTEYEEIRRTPFSTGDNFIVSVEEGTENGEVYYYISIEHPFAHRSPHPYEYEVEVGEWDNLESAAKAAKEATDLLNRESDAEEFKTNLDSWKFLSDARKVYERVAERISSKKWVMAESKSIKEDAHDINSLPRSLDVEMQLQRIINDYVTELVDLSKKNGVTIETYDRFKSIFDQRGLPCNNYWWELYNSVMNNSKSINESVREIITSLIDGSELEIIDKDVVPGTTSFTARYLSDESPNRTFTFILADKTGDSYLDGKGLDAYKFNDHLDDTGYNLPTEILEIDGQDNVYYMTTDDFNEFKSSLKESIDDEIITRKYLFDPSEWVGNPTDIEDYFEYTPNEISFTPNVIKAGQPTVLTLKGIKYYLDDFASKYGDFLEDNPIDDHIDKTYWKGLSDEALIDWWDRASKGAGPEAQYDDEIFDELCARGLMDSRGELKTKSKSINEDLSSITSLADDCGKNTFKKSARDVRFTFEDEKSASKFMDKLKEKNIHYDELPKGIIKVSKASVLDESESIEKRVSPSGRGSASCKIWIDIAGIMGEPNEKYTLNDLADYWTDNNGSDPSLAVYKGDWKAWLDDTISQMEVSYDSSLCEESLTESKNELDKLNTILAAQGDELRRLKKDGADQSEIDKIIKDIQDTKEKIAALCEAFEHTQNEVKEAKPPKMTKESKEEAWTPDMTECPACGDTSFDSKKGKCTKCSYRESLAEANKIAPGNEKYKGFMIRQDHKYGGYTVYDKHDEQEDSGFKTVEAARAFIDKLISEDDKTLTESNSLKQDVQTAIYHLVHDLGRDPESEDFAEDVVLELEKEFNEDEIPTDPIKYRDWASAIMSEVSRQLNSGETEYILESESLKEVLSYDEAENLRIQLAKPLKLSDYEAETFEHDINNGRAYEWLPEVEKLPEDTPGRAEFIKLVTHYDDLDDESYPVNENGVSSSISEEIDAFLEEIAQAYGGFDYNDIIKFNPSENDINKLNDLLARYEEAITDEDESEAIAKQVANIVNKNSLTETSEDPKSWPDDKELTYEEALALAKAYYAQGGDGFYETTEKYQFEDEVKMFGPITVRQMKRKFGVFDSVAKDRMGDDIL